MLLAPIPSPRSAPDGEKGGAFSETDLRRAIRAAKAEGLAIGAVEIRDNSLMIRVGEPMSCDQETGDPTLDALLREAVGGMNGARREAN